MGGKPWGLGDSQYVAYEFGVVNTFCIFYTQRVLRRARHIRLRGCRTYAQLSRRRNALRIAPARCVLYCARMISHSDIIARWGSIKEFAEDIGVLYVTAQVMKHRNSIHPRHWDAVITAAAARGIPGITYELLSRTRPRGRVIVRPRPNRRAETRAA